MNDLMDVFKPTFLIMALLWGLLACDSDDGPATTVTTQPTTSTFGDLNTCDINDGSAFATFFEFTIPYQSSAVVEIEKITTEWEWQNGGNGTNEETFFNDTGTTVTYDWCWRFGDDEWVDLTARLVTKQGVTSSASTIRLNKPNGAN